MAKEILLYTSINSYSVSDFINTLEANKGNDICIRMNTPGGSVYDGYGAIAKFNEFTGNKTIKVDGRADSFGAYMLCFTNPDNIECLDVTTMTFHRAAMPSWFEADANYFTDEMKASLNKTNAILRAGIESKVTAQRWKNITGVSLDDMFSLNSRIDVEINAEQAKKMGMVGKVIPITPSKLAEIKAYSLDLAAELTTHIQTENTDTMAEIKTLAELKAQFPAIYEAAKVEILATEKERIDSFAEFKDVDPKAVLEAIVKGDKYSSVFGAKMQVKAMSKEGLKNLAAANAGETNTGESADDGETDEAKAFEAQRAAIKAMAKKQLN